MIDSFLASCLRSVFMPPKPTDAFLPSLPVQQPSLTTRRHGACKPLALVYPPARRKPAQDAEKNVRVTASTAPLAVPPSADPQEPPPLINVTLGSTARLRMAVEKSGHFPLCGGGAADNTTGGESRRSWENGCCLRAIQDNQLAKALFQLTGRLAPCPHDSSLAPRPLDDANSPYRVFVTGATGFLGSHQLVSLLKTDRIEEVCCLVRARDGHTALQRLQAALSSHGLSLSADQWARVKPVPGDLSRPSFGLDGDAFATLAGGRFHAVYHFAAIDNFFLGWDELAAVNVGGLMDVIRFAWGSGGAGGRLPVVFYAGSCAARLHDVYRVVGDGADGRPPRRLGLYNKYGEHSTAQHSTAQRGGEGCRVCLYVSVCVCVCSYGYTKWLGRELLRWFARRGFPAVHYDIG